MSTPTRDEAAAAALLRSHTADLDHVLARSDTTSATLLTLATALLAGVGGAAALVRPHLTVVPVVLAAGGTVALVGAVLCALAAVRPRSGTGVTTWYGGREPAEVVTAAMDQSPAAVALGQAQQLVSLSRICQRKHALQRAAVDQLGGAVVLYTIAAAFALAGG